MDCKFITIQQPHCNYEKQSEQRGPALLFVHSLGGSLPRQAEVKSLPPICVWRNWPKFFKMLASWETLPGEAGLFPKLSLQWHFKIISSMYCISNFQHPCMVFDLMLLWPCCISIICHYLLIWALDPKKQHTNILYTVYWELQGFWWLCMYWYWQYWLRKNLMCKNISDLQ